jgi:hypothetical protein
VEVEQTGLTFEQIRERATSVSRVGVNQMRWILRSEVAAGRVIERDGRYALDPEVWERDQLDALRRLNDASR